MIKTKKILKYYSSLFPVSKEQLSFLVNSVNDNKNASFLDIECGLSDIGYEIAKKGFNVTAIESHPDFINLLNKKNKKLKDNFKTSSFSTMDIARRFGKNKFDVAFCINSRLLAIQDPILLTKFFFDTKIALKDGGILVVDLFNMSKVYSQDKIIFPLRKTAKHSLLVNLTRNDLTYELNATFVKNNKKEIPILQNEPSYPFTKQTIENKAKEVKFSSVEFYSDYNKTPFTENSERIICVLKK